MLHSSQKQELLLHQEHAKQIEVFANSGIAIDSTALSKLLRQYFDYQLLVIASNEGEALYHYAAPQSTSLVDPGFIIQSLQLDLAEQQVVLPEQGLVIKYKLNTEIADDSILFASELIITGALISLLFIAANKWQHYRNTTAIAKQIAEHIGQLNSNQPTDSLKLKQGKTFDVVDAALAQNLQYMNARISDAHEAAADIENQSYRDSLTGLPNRHQFISFINGILSGEDQQLSPGMLAICRCNALDKVNREQGYMQGDKLVEDIAKMLAAVTSNIPTSECFRLNGADFALVLPSATTEQAEHVGSQLQHEIANMPNHIIDLPLINLGMVAYQAGSPLGELLASADTAISLAQSQNNQLWYLQQDGDNTHSPLGKQNWRIAIDDIIENKRITVMCQPIEPINRNSTMYQEVLTRFYDSNQQMLPTAALFAMAVKLEKQIALDKLIVDSVIIDIKTLQIHEGFFGINLSPTSALNDEFVIWLERRLMRDSEIASRLIFEVSERGLQNNLEASQRFISMLSRIGSRITVEKFGVGMTSFKFFRDFKPDYIKMDGSYSRGIDEEKNNQYFLRLMVDLAHRLGVKVIAESVETEKEKMALERLLVDGAQGYLIGKPTKLQPPV